MQINRLFETIYILLDKEKVSAKELAERFEVSTRTIYRDVEILSSAGIPVFMTKGKGGGISLLPNFVLNKTVLTEYEKISILSALQSLNTVDEEANNNTLKKLGLFFGENNTGFIEVDYSDWGNLIKDQFEQAKKAILSRKVLSFDYVSAVNMATNRNVEPYVLWFKDRNWYLKCFCLDKQEVRIFRLSRMRNVIITENNYIPREIEYKVIANSSTDNLTTIKVQISKDQTYRVLDEFLPDKVSQNKDGSFTVTMNFIEDEWVYGYILSFGCSATVLEPEHIKDIVKCRLKKSLDNYYCT